MQSRFHADAHVQSAELLLQERSPHLVPLDHPPEEHRVEETPGRVVQSIVRRYVTPHTITPRAHLLSNGSLSTMVTNGGGGYTRWRDIAVTRWREDSTTDAWGSFCYLRDLETGDAVGVVPTRAVGKGQRDHHTLLLLTRCLRTQVSGFPSEKPTQIGLSGRLVRAWRTSLQLRGHHIPAAFASAVSASPVSSRLSLRSRARALHGRLALRSRPGCTEVTLDLPVQAAGVEAGKAPHLGAAVVSA